MRKGDSAILKMEKALCAGREKDETAYPCTVLQYDEKKECIYFVLDKGSLTTLSLDAVYECRVQSGEMSVRCVGRVKERYRSEWGQVFKFEIKNGFYKINIKPVDKQMT